jgi:hypothetical protein
MPGWNVSAYLVKQRQPFDPHLPLVFEAFGSAARPQHGQSVNNVAGIHN